MRGQHTHRRIHPAPKRKPLEYCGVIIDGTGTKSPADYEQAVLPHLSRILQSRTGQAVFDGLGSLRYRLRIVPHKVKKNATLEDKLDFGAKFEDDRHAFKKGEVEYFDEDDSLWPGGLKHNAADNKPIVIGEGGGSNSTIEFNPNAFTMFCNRQKPGHKSGCQSDEVLFHEMVHAHRGMLGILSSMPLGYYYDDVEEFFAILLANIYASDTGRPTDLRLNHDGRPGHLFEPLAPADTDEAFLPVRDDRDFRYWLVDKLVYEQPGIAQRLRRIKCPFNPIPRYFELQHATIHVSPPDRLGG